MRALLIFNPVAGRRPARRQAQLEQLARLLRHAGWQVETATTEPDAGAAPAAARGMTAGFDVLVGCGGDGTLHQIAQALATRPGDAPALAVAPPLGTANIFARTVGCPRHPAAAARWLLAAKPRLRPLGAATTPEGTRHFLVVASAGYDAAIARDLSAEAKRRWGKLAYAASATVAWRRYFPAPMNFTIGTESGQADGLIFGLSPYYGGGLRLGRLGPDGALRLALRGAPARLPLWALAMLTVGLERAPGVERLPAAPLAISTPGLPLEFDGEPAGATPATLTITAPRLRCLY